MEIEKIQKIESSIENLKSKKCKLFFLVQDTKGNAKASVRYIYQIAKVLNDEDYNVTIIHEKNDYKGVSEWLGEEYMELNHESIENQNLKISPEDFIFIPELYAHVMEQLSNITCGKIVISQSYDYILETLQPGTSWSQYNFLKCITTTEEQKKHIESLMKQTSVDVIEPLIPNSFNTKDKPSKPIVSIHTRDQRDTMKIIKSFYLKYPQYRWITFRDMRGLNQDEFSEYLKDSYVSIWVDDISSFGTFPIESMLCGTPVIGKIPNLKHSWMNEENGIWTTDVIGIPDVLAEFTQNWLEDNINYELYDKIFDTSEKYQQEEKFKNQVTKTIDGFISYRKENMETQLNKIKETEEV
jgi:glycosyltransferase involved in cell wall biosynthesis